MQFKVSSVFVDDQEKALRFYTDVLGFVKKTDISLGEYKWLTIVSPEGPEDIELLLEPNDNPAARMFQEAIYEQGIPARLFAVKDIQQEYERLIELGVVFSKEPTQAGPVKIAMFDDTCGNHIQIAQM